MTSSRPSSSRVLKGDPSEIQSQNKTTTSNSRVSSANVTKEKQSSVPIKATSNIEMFACFWLDQDVYKMKNNQKIQNELRKIINHLQIFENPDECEQAIRSITQEKIILISSNSLGHQIVPRLHDLPQFTACYIFCLDQADNKQWTTNYAKVCDNKLIEYF
jgi:hypothetical protein